MKNNDIYIPISEIENVYNIKLKNIDKEKIIVIDFLDEEQNQAMALKKVKVKNMQDIFSRNVDKIEKDENVIVIQQLGDWLKILTPRGKVGYVKTKDFSKAYCFREKMIISAKANQNDDLKNINIEDYLERLDSYNTRLEVVEEILIQILNEGKQGVLIQVQENNDKYSRFLIELIPRLKEIGLKIDFSQKSIIEKEILELI